LDRDCMIRFHRRNYSSESASLRADFRNNLVTFAIRGSQGAGGESARAFDHLSASGQFDD
jgi:hypothetical protein